VRVRVHVHVRIRFSVPGSTQSVSSVMSGR
jgi:hypothetical protein